MKYLRKQVVAGKYVSIPDHHGQLIGTMQKQKDVVGCGEEVESLPEMREWMTRTGRSVSDDAYVKSDE